MARHPTTSPEAPPRGRGHYNDDGTQWWDDTRQRWFRTTDDEDLLEIDVEDAGHTSMLRSVATTMTGQHGAQSYRFVAQAHSGDPQWSDFIVTSGTFPVLPLQLPIDRVGPDEAHGDEMRARLDELERELVAKGGGPLARASTGGRSATPARASTGTPRLDRPAPNMER